MALSASSWIYCPDNDRSTGAYINFYQGGPIDHGTHVPGPVSQSSAEIQYNAECTAGMALEYFRMLINELLNNDTDIVSQEYPLTILDSKSYVCMANNDKDTKKTRHMYRRVHFVINGGKCQMHKIDWCEVVLQLTYIATNNVGENYLNPRMKYIVVRLDN